MMMFASETSNLVDALAIISLTAVDTSPDWSTTETFAALEEAAAGRRYGLLGADR